MHWQGKTIGLKFFFESLRSWAFHACLHLARVAFLYAEGRIFFGIFGTSTLSRFSAGTGLCVLLVVLLCWAVWIRSGWIFVCNGAPLISPLISKIRH